MHSYQESCLNDPSKSFFNVTFKKNYDGDTFTVDIEEPGYKDIFSKKIPVRLKNIDTAEIRTKDNCEKTMAILAKERMYDILSKAEIIDICESERCKYFRVLGEVWADKQYVQDILLNEKLAVPYDALRPIDWCKAYLTYMEERPVSLLEEVF